MIFILFNWGNVFALETSSAYILKPTKVYSDPDSCNQISPSEQRRINSSACEIVKSILHCDQLLVQHSEFEGKIIKCDYLSMRKNYRDSQEHFFESCKKGLMLATQNWTDDAKSIGKVLARGLQQDYYIFFHPVTTVKVMMNSHNEGSQNQDSSLTQEWYRKSVKKLASILSFINQKVMEDNQEMACFTESAKTEMGCYMGGLIYDPIIAASAVFKAAKIAKIARDIDIIPARVTAVASNDVNTTGKISETVKTVTKASSNKNPLKDLNRISKSIRDPKQIQKVELGENDNYLKSIESTDGGFVNSRGLEDWNRTFGTRLSDDLQGLTEDSHVIDFGAGQGFGGEQLLNTGTKAKVTMISQNFERPILPRKNLTTIQQYYEKILPGTLKPFDVGIDLMGVGTYTKDVRGYFNSVLNLANKPNAKLYVQTYKKSTEILVKTTLGEKKLTLVEWLTQQKNVVVNVLKEDNGYITFEVHTTGPVNLPQLNGSYTEGIPPIRILRQVD